MERMYSSIHTEHRQIRFGFLNHAVHLLIQGTVQVVQAHQVVLLREVVAHQAVLLQEVIVHQVILLQEVAVHQELQL